LLGKLTKPLIANDEALWKSWNNLVNKDCLTVSSFFFFSVRQKVLETKKHELLWPGIGAFQLTVQLPTAPDEVQDVFEGEIPTKELETKEHVKESDVSEMSQHNEGLVRYQTLLPLGFHPAHRDQWFQSP